MVKIIQASFLKRLYVSGIEFLVTKISLMVFFYDIAFRENLSASSISNYDCILSPFFIPRPSERNAINIVQFSDKSTEDFPVICYTDGSKIDGRVGFAFVVFRSGVESENFQFRIRDECTVFVAELLCLNFAVKWITEQNSVISEYLICTDSLSSLDSLKCISSSNNIIVEIQKQLKCLRDKNISIDFAFVRGHTGVLGNERADWLSKAATKRKIDIDVNIPKSFYKKITKERMVKSWNQKYLISNKGSITKKFFPTINKRLSCHHFYTNYKLTQCLPGHGNFKSYLNKFNLVPSSFCDCNIGGEENVEHVILLCSKLKDVEGIDALLGTTAITLTLLPCEKKVTLLSIMEPQNSPKLGAERVGDSSSTLGNTEEYRPGECTGRGVSSSQSPELSDHSEIFK
ncbi:RNase H domain-containing protein [Trichonephila clavipes]|nr:RNase H domain-containing protein [Trichonephila clavipes]